MKVVVTGFGPFGEITINPSSIVARNVSKNLNGDNISSEFVQLEASVSSVKKFYNNRESSNKECFIIHFGVYSGADKIYIERRAKNYANFSIPDYEGITLTREKVSAEYDLGHRLYNRLDFSNVAAKYSGQVAMSDDPGEYVCNFIYFLGLHHDNKYQNGCVFIHIPLFETMNQEEQTEIATNVVKDILELAKSKK